MTQQGSFILDADDLDGLIRHIAASGYQVIGPALQEGAITYRPISGAADLPQGWRDQQEKGEYRLARRDDDAYFGFASTAQSWKRYLFPPRQRRWQTTGDLQHLVFHPAPDPPPAALALFGVRSCDLHAIAIQDKVFGDGEFRDELYLERRRQALIVAVQCTAEASTCFCTAMGTGPSVDLPHDLLMTEVVGEQEHHFLISSGSERGKALLEALPVQPAREEQARQARQAVDDTAARIAAGPRAIDSSDFKDLLYRNYESTHWDEVADRCLSCANCTMVCPTCFCSTAEDVTSLDGSQAEHWQRWDSCFTNEHSYVHGGAIRFSTRARYRQWLTHKLATWIDQFGTSGCSGCGRCISWCPVGIDLTEEITAIRREENAHD